VIVSDAAEELGVRFNFTGEEIESFFALLPEGTSWDVMYRVLELAAWTRYHNGQVSLPAFAQVVALLLDEAAA
jgi:hypothetical protein